MMLLFTEASNNWRRCGKISLCYINDNVKGNNTMFTALHIIYTLINSVMWRDSIHHIKFGIYSQKNDFKIKLFPKCKFEFPALTVKSD